MHRAAALLLLLGGSAAADSFVLHKARSAPDGWVSSKKAADRAGRFNVQVGVRRTNTDKLTKKLMAISDPSSPEYLQQFTWEQAGKAFRPTQESIDAVLSWLRSAGADKVDLHPHGDTVRAEMTAAQLEAATGGRFEQFQHMESGRVVERMVGGVSLPASLADHVDTFTGFHGFPLIQKVQKSKVGAGAGKVTPAVINAIHNITKVEKSGKQNIQAIAQFQGQYVSTKDLSDFCTKYEPFGNKCEIAKFIGSNSPGEPGVESMLDTEYIMGLGQGTETWVYSYPSFDFCSDLITFAGDLTANSTFPYSVSISYGSQKIDFCDSTSTNRLSQDFQKAATQGITIMISSGDDGSGYSTRQGNNGGLFGNKKVSPSFPASIPWVTAVGATYFVSGTSGEQEASTQFGSGGGFSFDFDVPDYQKDAVSAYLSSTTLPPSEYAYATTGRGSPDVSLLGEQFNVEVNGGDEAVGGTSASSPSFAAVVTLLNEVCLKAANKPLGFANPFFYTKKYASGFVDVTKGTSAIGGNKKTDVWKAQAGWDASTGLGIPDFPELVKHVKDACSNAK